MGRYRLRQALRPAARKPEGNVARQREAPAAVFNVEQRHWHATARDRLAHGGRRGKSERAIQRRPTEHRPVPLVKAPLNFLS